MIDLGLGLVIPPGRSVWHWGSILTFCIIKKNKCKPGFIAADFIKHVIRITDRISFKLLDAHTLGSGWRWL